MNTWYKADKWDYKISVVQVEKETNSFLIIKKSWGKQRESKNSTWSIYFKSFQEAKNYIINQIKEKITYLEKELDSQKQTLLKAVNFKNDKEE